MTKSKIFFLSLAMLLSACGNAGSQQVTQSSTEAANATASPTPMNTPSDAVRDEVANQLQANLAKSGLDAKIMSVTATQMPGIYLVAIENMAPVFSDSTGQYIIQGDILKVGGEVPIDLSATIRADLAKAELDALDTKDMIVFAAKGDKKSHIYVFSDPTCHYCQLLHQEIEGTTAAGIEVRYLAWPRSDQMMPLAEAIWCSTDRHTALTAAKQNVDRALATLSQVPKCQNPVADQVALGFKIGVSATPAIFAENGVQIGGYLPTNRLAKAAMDNIR